jgi:small GTP-binding protein
MKESEKIHDCKITLVGDSGVGKTSIIGRYVTGIFMQEISSTAGLNYSHKFYEKNGKKLLNLNLWDTAGQEKFRSLGKNFYKDSYIVLIIYDISNKESFENIKEIWYPDIEYYGEKIKILALVGNKKDKYEEEQISEEEAKSYAEEINAKFFLVSANTGEGIDNLFSSLADNFLDKEFKDKVDESKLERIDSIFLNKEDVKNDISKSHNKCC